MPESEVRNVPLAVTYEIKDGNVWRTGAGKRGSVCALAVTYGINDGKDRRKGAGKRDSECALAVMYGINDGKFGGCVPESETRSVPLQ